MAKAVGLIGSLKGKVGNTVFATRRGIQVARVYQPVVAQPKSARQQLSRAKFALATDTLRPFNLFLRAGWQKTRPTYEFQQGVKRVIPVDKAIMTGSTPETIQIDYTLLAEVFSAGGLQGIVATTPTSAEEGKVEFNVTVPAADFLDEHGANVDCGIVIAVYNNDLGQVKVFNEKELTADVAKAITLDVPTNWSGMRVYVYVFAKQIPTAVNGIPSTDLPWMYPAKTSECICAGSVDVA